MALNAATWSLGRILSFDLIATDLPPKIRQSLGGMDHGVTLILLILVNLSLIGIINSLVKIRYKRKVDKRRDIIEKRYGSYEMQYDYGSDDHYHGMPINKDEIEPTWLTNLYISFFVIFLLLVLLVFVSFSSLMGYIVLQF